MKGLLLKDLKIVMGQKRLFVMALLIAAIFVWSTEDVTFAASYIVVMMSMLSLSTIGYDEMNGNEDDAIPGTLWRDNMNLSHFRT